MILVDLASSSLQEVAHKYYCLPRTGCCHRGISVQLRFVMAFFDMNSLGLVWFGHLGQVVVIEVENSKMLQTRKSSRVHTADSVLKKKSFRSW